MHYVIGDVHGCYNALMRLLERLCLSSEDIVFFVGDFVDRAPSHEEMLKTNRWVCEHISEEGQFRAVIGNHDLDMLDTYRELAAFEGMPEMSMLTTEDTLESIRNVTNALRKLPLYRQVEAGGFRNIITHSWVCDAAGNTAIEDDGSIREDFSINESVWDRCHSVQDRPASCRVIHGHTITSSSYYDASQKGVRNRIVRLGDTNINIDCGCFMGLSNGGNLAAFCLEDGMEFYAYDSEDAQAEYRELARLSKEPYKLKDYQIFLVCNPLKETVVFQDDSPFTKYTLERLTGDYGLDCSDRETFSRECRDYMRWWSRCVRRSNAIDRRFVLWRE